MISRVRESLNNIFHERLTSPFYGALIVSWLIWNWKIVYLTLLINREELEMNKIEYIVTYYSDIWNILYLPLISTVIIVKIFPFFTNGAYYLALNFDSWKIEKRNQVEKKQLLTVEQSIQLREQISNQEQRFNSLLTEKNEEIKRLELQLDNLRNKDGNDNKIIPSNLNTANSASFLAQKILYNEELKKAHNILQKIIDRGDYSLNNEEVINSVDAESLSFYEINELIGKSDSMYTGLPKEKRLNELYITKNFNFFFTVLLSR